MPELLQRVHTTDTLWAELDWILQHEAIVHLDDLMLRRTRLGLLVGQGGACVLPRLKPMCRKHLGWDETRWNKEVADYVNVWQKNYSLPTFQQYGREKVSAPHAGQLKVAAL
jgi:glycerol-3-phosphate dehydrogenase